MFQQSKQMYGPASIARAQQFITCEYWIPSAESSIHTLQLQRAVKHFVGECPGRPLLKNGTPRPS
jgi:hypothetical protein